MRRGRAPRRQRWPGPTLAQGVLPHLPRNPWRRRALLPQTAGNAAAAPAALNGAFHHNEARRDLRAAAGARRAAIGPGTASRGQAGLQGDAARDWRRCRVKHWRRVPGWAASRGRLRGGHVGSWQTPFCVLASGPAVIGAAPELAVAKLPQLYPPPHTRRGPGVVAPGCTSTKICPYAELTVPGRSEAWAASLQPHSPGHEVPFSGPASSLWRLQLCWANEMVLQNKTLV